MSLREFPQGRMGVPFVVEPMEFRDIPEVTAIERESFTTPWPVYAYRRELKDNRNSRYIVVRWLDERRGDAAPISLPTPATTQSPRQKTSDSPLLKRLLLRFLLSFGNHARTKEEKPEGAVVGYAGLWLIHDEGHVTTIAVRPDLRGTGIGELMLVRLIELAREIGAKRMTLEVRISNEIAQKLYRKYTFQVEGVRRRYYSDDNEDALIMWSEVLDSPSFQSRFADLRSALIRRFGDRLIQWQLT